MAEIAVAGVGLALSVAQTLLTAAQTPELRKMCSRLNCDTQLGKLLETVKSVKSLLHHIDSQECQGLRNEPQDWVEKLKDAVYDFDDLLDEMATVDQLRKQREEGKLYKKVGNFFSPKNKFLVDFNMSKEIMKLRERLADIAIDHERFGSTDMTKRVLRPETCSRISELEVIGRDTDLKTILQKLLPDSDTDTTSPSNNVNGRFVCIVGMGGLGKTTLAQLVYNHEKVSEAFSPRIWACVSDQFGPKEILGKILKEEVANLEAAQEKVKALLQNKRFLLVLDDVWNEYHEKWRDLMPYLVSDVSGSKIIVTSRSERVANSIGGVNYLHKLPGLSQENSWRLFKRVAFETEREDEVDQGLVSIAKDIVKKCVNVPLCIRVIASFLHDQPKDKWESCRSIDLSADRHGAEGTENSIMATLRFSYYRLTPELKSCFSLCSLFPKDHEMKKELLIRLWMAEGYLVPTGNTQSFEDVGDQYFTILLNRCFFQDIMLDEYGDVYSFKMHDLMHDLALSVAGKESLSNNTLVFDDRLRNNIRHLSTTIRDRTNCSLTNTLRTYVSVPTDFNSEETEILEASSLDQVTRVIQKCKRLRVLSLSRFAISCNLPESLGKLLHLRFLDLSENGFELLPKSITKLHNLQILKLCDCTELKKLPENLSKLVNLRVLDTRNCNALTYMPRGMNNLKELHTVTEFVVGGIDSNETQGSKLGDLQVVRRLKGDLCIPLLDFRSASIGFIFKKSRCNRIEIECRNDSDFDLSQVQERLVEYLCPNDDIFHIEMLGYEGTKLPSWATPMESDMNGLQHVTSLSRFRHLKVLELYKLKNVEYIEVASRGWESNTFFPVLEMLVLSNMPKLKGWWKGLELQEGGRGGSDCLVDGNNGGDVVHAASALPCFPQLHGLIIHHCESMTYFPPCPHVKQLDISGVNEALTFCMKGGASPSDVSASLCLDRLLVKNGRVMNSILSEFVGGAVDLILCGDEEMKSMGIVREAFGRLCWKLKRLEIARCYELDMEDEEEEGMPWKYLQSLSSLKLTDLPKMVKLPKGIQYLTSLQSLEIARCDNLEEVGECIGFLTSLQSLCIEYCGKLKALPERIDFLTSLQSLSLFNCKGIKSLPESMRHLTSLTKLILVGTSHELKEADLLRVLGGNVGHIPTLLI